jgi:hypothetical protein
MSFNMMRCMSRMLKDIPISEDEYAEDSYGEQTWKNAGASDDILTY